MLCMLALPLAGGIALGAPIVPGAALGAPSARGVARGTPATKVVRYDGYRLVVPAGWPVFRIRSDPTVCVRFDRHAVYLGRPSPEQDCPAHAAGRTEAILIEPASASAASAAALRALRAPGSAASVNRRCSCAPGLHALM